MLYYSGITNSITVFRLYCFFKKIIFFTRQPERREETWD